MSNAQLNERITKLEGKFGINSDEPGWTDHITISGAVEAEAGFTSKDYDDPATDDVDESDIVLATVELGIDAEIHKHVSGRVLLLWEEDDIDSIDMDEGFITIDGKDVVPLYLNAGKFYLPFGNFESHMVTDPVTLELGETNQSAVQVGFANDWIDASIAVFNGDVDEVGDDDTICSYVGSIQISLPEGTVANLGMSAGISYISNIADSDALAGELALANTVQDSVAGLGAFLNVTFKEMLFLKAEYIGALDNFQAGEFTNIDGGSAIEPSAWNLELAYAAMDNLEVALRYAKTDDIKGGIDDAGAFPESQYGATVAYGLFDSTTVALEYLKGEYENNDEQTVVTAQLAIEF
ncbi:MAG: LbtU family siderophore porin [Desulfobacteraceae bacterium]